MPVVTVSGETTLPTAPWSQRAFSSAKARATRSGVPGGNVNVTRPSSDDTLSEMRRARVDRRRDTLTSGAFLRRNSCMPRLVLRFWQNTLPREAVKGFDSRAALWQLPPNSELTRMRNAMPKEEWGTKRVCPATGKRFYDLNKTPIVSPYTGEVVNLETGKGKRSLSADKSDAASAKKKEEEAKASEEEDEIVLDDDDDDSDVDLGDDVLEDDDDSDDVSLDDIADVAKEDDD